MVDVELLAPAGSYDSMTAAFAAGADAVYLGGMKFGARAFANNLDMEQMKRAIDFAHIHNRRLYLTVNTLLKDHEMEELYDYLNPYYIEGLDAVIVQDFGVMKYVREQFPDMAVHASTQMTATGDKAARLLKDYGATRIVTAREMNLSEIKRIHDHVDIEIESFVHGALCFCYSGQCLYSSMIGGRSGNRGRCAQPCRLPYTLLQDGRVLSSADAPYLMSPKDICTVTMIPDLVEAGIYSFKMEGRMKKPVYTAGITSIYRKYLDLYLEKGREGFQVSEEDQNRLADLYNRGGFSLGYYKQHNGKEMMSQKRPNHMGVPAARVISAQGEVKLQSLEKLQAGDILEIPGQRGTLDFTLGEKTEKHKIFRIKPAKGMQLKKNLILYRTRNQMLIDELEEAYVKTALKRKISGHVTLKKNQNAVLTVGCGDFSVTVQGGAVMAANTRPLTREAVEKQIKKTGQTHVVFDQIAITMDEDIFLPMQALNDLRRRAIEEMEEAWIKHGQREERVRLPLSKFREERLPFRSLTVSAETMEQLHAALEYQEVERIYVNSTMLAGEENPAAASEKLVSICHGAGKECFLITPWIHRNEKEQNVLFDPAMLSLYDGLLIKSLETLAVLRKMNYKKRLIADMNLYTCNQSARAFLRSYGVESDTAPVELNCQELRKRGCENSELIIYGYTPLMISAQCFRKNNHGCDKKSSLSYLRDRKGICFPVKNFCSSCANVIYNSAPTELIDHMEEIAALYPVSVRLSFTVEDQKETRMVLEAYCKQVRGTKPVHETFTRGHFKRGVD